MLVEETVLGRVWVACKCGPGDVFLVWVGKAGFGLLRVRLCNVLRSVELWPGVVVRGWFWVGFRCWGMVGLRGGGPACFVWSGFCRVWNTLSWNARESTDNWGPYY